ncbi:MAG TPA: stage V sporulation protein AA [Tissierellaceae bacterium]
MDKEKVYLKINKKATVEPDKIVYLKDIGEVYSTNDKLKKDIENIKIIDRHNKEDWGYISAIQIGQKVLEKHSNVDLELIGETEVLLEFKNKEEKKPFWEFIKVAFVCLVLFFGGALAIINFHEDVNTRKTMKDLYYFFTGVEQENPLLLVIPYSIGIGFGVMIFFSKIFSPSLRRKKEPGPMEIELYQYELDMEDTILNDTKNNKGS